MAANAATQAAVTAAQGVKQILLKLGTQAVVGLFSGGASYITSAVIKGEGISFEDCMKSMLVGGMTGMLTCLCSIPLEKITSKVNWLGISLQVLSGAFSGAGSYLLALAITGGEFNLQAFIMATAMGATMAAVTAVGNKIVRTVKTAQAKRAENTQRQKEKTQEDILKRLQDDALKMNKDYAGKRKYFEPGTPLADKYPNGLYYDENGFARFEEYAYKFNNGEIVKVDFNFPSEVGLVNGTCLNGDYNHDSRLANAKVGFSKTPNGYVWHHVEDMQTMILVPKDIHNNNIGGGAHTGGASLIKKYLAEIIKK